LLRIEYVLLLVCFYSAFNAQAADLQTLDFNLESGEVIHVSHYQSDSSKLFIWLPSERGVSEHSLEVANRLADIGNNVWVVDLHSSYMVSTSRYSVDEFPVSDITQLLIEAKQGGYEQVYFLSANRGASLVLGSIIQFSRIYPASSLIKGSILIHPYIYESLPAMGEAARFIANSDKSHLPIYMIQPQYSTKYLFTEDIRRQLEKGGSQVFTHKLKNVEGGFYARPAEDLSPAAIEAKQQLPETIDRASRLLAQIKPASLVSRETTEERSKAKPIRESSLSVYKGQQRRLHLELPDLNGQMVNLEQYRGRVVLVNFWASWCKPCVREIPSLSRLGEHFADKAFDIVTVNIGESAERVALFLDADNQHLQVLLDQEGNAVRNWRVYAFPSNFLLDQSGEIQYAYRGALEWDSPEVVKIIESLL